MSYDIRLNERATGETILLPIKHMMIGGTYRADYDEKTRSFSPAATRDACLNITYNYSRYYYEATEGDDRFYGVEDWNDEGYHNCGIRGIYGKTGLESIPMLKDLAARIESKYKRDGEWITNRRKETIFRDADGKERHPVELLVHKMDYTKEEVEIDVNEGDTSRYWDETAANAIKPLYQLLVFAELRPDGVWDGD